MMTHNDLRSVFLVLGAAVVALMGLLVPLHMASAHHCDAHHGDDIDACAICLHWQHHAATTALAVVLPSVEFVTAAPLAIDCRAGSSPLRQACGRAPPARV